LFFTAYLQIIPDKKPGQRQRDMHDPHTIALYFTPRAQKADGHFLPRFVANINKMLIFKYVNFCSTCHGCNVALYWQKWAIIYNVSKGSRQPSTLGQHSTSHTGVVPTPALLLLVHWTREVSTSFPQLHIYLVKGVATDVAFSQGLVGLDFYLK
jgi:hypothetical protein